MSLQSKANILMVIVTMFWGLSYTFMVMGLEALETYNIVLFRCAMAFIVASLIFYKKMKNVQTKTLLYSAIQGFLLFIVFSLSLFGLETTSVSNAGFILSLTVVLVPIFISIMDRKLPSRAVTFAVISTMVGISILTIKESLSFQPGDLLVAIAAVAYSIYLILNSTFTKSVESISYGVFQLGFAAIFAFVLCLMFETPSFPTTSNGWLAIIGLGLICTAFCFIAQTVAQQYTTPTHTGLIFSIEPIFAAIFAMIFLGEAITARLVLGGGFILLGNLVAQIEQFYRIRFISNHTEQEKAA
ncbi:DMT family transporter [Lysinibacillus sp. 54212]|uniref:DMT family transporter n=1 Tax=Lysinibacillus sp. 54212 TaxID=3119829 RepID=UPI002FC8FD5A